MNYQSEITDLEFKALLEYYSQFEKDDPPDYIDNWNSRQAKKWIKWNGRINYYKRRSDLPCYISNTLMVWTRWGKLHRLGGPARISNLGGEEYYICNKLFKDKNEYFKENELINKNIHPNFRSI